MKKLSMMLFLGAAVVAMGLAAPSAEANCSSPQFFGTNDFAPNFCSYAYLVWNDTSAEPTNFVGSFWDTGNRATGVSTSANGDTCDVGFWFYQYDAANWSMFGALGDACVTPVDPPACPGANLTVFLENCSTDEFMLLTAPRNASVACTNGGLDFNFSYYMYNDVGASFVAGPSPRPRVNSSGRTGSDVTINVTIPNPTSGVFDASGGLGAVAGFEIFSQSLARGSAPDTVNTSGWTLAGSVGATGGDTDVVVDCSNEANDQWIATSVVTGAGDRSPLGCPVQVECRASLANPDPDKIKRIRKPGARRETRD